MKNMIHQTAQNTLFFCSSLHVIKSLKQSLQCETQSSQCHIFWYMDTVLKAHPAFMFRLSSIV